MRGNCDAARVPTYRVYEASAVPSFSLPSFFFPFSSFISNIGTLTKPHRSLLGKKIQVSEPRQHRKMLFRISNLMQALFNEIGRETEKLLVVAKD